MQQTQQLPLIYAYIDFRAYLADYRAQRKALDPAFTHAYICRRLGQAAAKTYFNNVVAGRKDISPVFIDRFIALLELNADEAKYFRAMVSYNQATSPHEKEFFLDQLVRLNMTPHRVIDQSAYCYFREWHHSVVRALLDIVDFKSDYKDLAARIVPSITVKQVRESVALLKTLKLVARDERGFLKPTDKILTTGDYIKDAMVRQFQMTCLEHAKQVLATAPGSTHRGIDLTISLSEPALATLIERVGQFKKEVRSIIHKDTERATKVYHLSLILFPQTR